MEVSLPGPGGVPVLVGVIVNEPPGRPAWPYFEVHYGQMHLGLHTNLEALEELHTLLGEVLRDARLRQEVQDLASP